MENSGGTSLCWRWRGRAHGPDDLRTVTIWHKRVRWGRLAHSIWVPCAVKSMQSWTEDMFRSRWKAGCSVISHGAPEPVCFCATLGCMSPQSHWEKPLHIHCTCWINGLWFRSLSGWIRVKPHSLHTFLESVGITRQLFTGHFLLRFWCKVFCLQKMNKIDRDWGQQGSRTAECQVLLAFKHLDTIHF